MKKPIRITLIVLAILLIAWLLAPTHLKRALLHGRANIDDFKIFDNRIVQNAEPIHWVHDSLYNIKQISSGHFLVMDSF